MPKYLIEVDLDNAEFDNETCNFALAAVLKGIADKLEQYAQFEQALRDSNGNAIGKATIDGECGENRLRAQ